MELDGTDGSEADDGCVHCDLNPFLGTTRVPTSNISSLLSPRTTRKLHSPRRLRLNVPTRN